MRRRLTESQYERANEAASRRRFQAMSYRGSRVQLAKPMPGLIYWFERKDVAQDGVSGEFWRDTDLAVITLVVDGKPSVLFYLVGVEIDTCTFAYNLYPRQLDAAVLAMRRAGLSRFIKPAAEWALREMPEPCRPLLESALRTLLSRKTPRASKRRITMRFS
jgi:hypothetical protein